MMMLHSSSIQSYIPSETEIYIPSETEIKSPHFQKVAEAVVSVIEALSPFMDVYELKQTEEGLDLEIFERR